MRVIPIRPMQSLAAPLPSPRAVVEAELRDLVVGSETEGMPLPPLADVLSAALALGEGTRVKSLLPVESTPAELVLVRRGAEVLVSYVRTEGALDVRLLDRPMPLRALLDGCAKLARRAAEVESHPELRDLCASLADRAQAIELGGRRGRGLEPVTRSGGTLTEPSAKVPLAFGFEASIAAVPSSARAAACSDAHALLFGGELVAWARGKRFVVARGPILLAAARMLAAARATIEAWEAGRASHVRLRAGGFRVGVRLERGKDEGAVQLTLGGGGRDASLTVPSLSVAEATLPILRLVTDLLRALVQVDRSQAKNLRVAALREEVRGLRRRVRAGKPGGEHLINRDAARLRASAPPEAPVAKESTLAPSPRALRFGSRWELEVEGLDAASTFLCGDRLVVATSRRTVAIARDDGEQLWARPERPGTSLMAGRVLVHLGVDGRIALSDVDDGEPYAELRLAPRPDGAAPLATLATGRGLPPTLILAEGRERLAAIDLRTGELRWRQRVRRGARALTRAGRVLLVVGGDGALTALDATHGELLHRYADADAPFAHAATVHGDNVLLAGGRAGGEGGALVALDLYSGALRWRRPLDAPPSSAPITLGPLAVVALGRGRDASAGAFEPSSGRLKWMVPDPGIAHGAACLSVDRWLIVNAPSGRVSALDARSGELAWQRRLAHPVADDVPRRLEPVLRNGALFVPAAAVHVLRLADGTSIGQALPSELVPDWMRVDERGWVYIGEESGYIAAMAPAAQLSLVR